MRSLAHKYCTVSDSYVNAEQQMHLALKIGKALTDAGVKVQRAQMVQGNLKGWDDVPAEGIIGRWLQNGWRVVEADTDTVTEGEKPTVTTERRLKLV